MQLFRSFFWHWKHHKQRDHKHKGPSPTNGSVLPETVVTCHSPADVLALLSSLPDHDSHTSQWLVWSFPDAVDIPLHLARVVPALAAHPHFRHLFERREPLEDIVNHYVPLFAYPDRLSASAIAVKLHFLEFFAHWVARQLETSPEFERAQFMLFKARASRFCPVEMEYRLFSILTENLRATTGLIGPEQLLQLLIALAGSFPVGSALHVVAIRYILGLAGPDFPYSKLMEVLSRQGITDHFDLIVFVDVMNLCRGQVCKDAMLTFLKATRQDIWRRSVMKVMKTRLDPHCFEIQRYQLPIRRFLCHTLGTMKHARCEEAELARRLIVDLIALGIPRLARIIQECAIEMRCHDL
jgi:hypothetical protein